MLYTFSTYVLYGLYPDRLHVRVGLCSLGSQMRISRCRSLSSAGDLSTMYDIHACLGPVSDSRLYLEIFMYEIGRVRVPSRLNLRAAALLAMYGCKVHINVRVELVVLVVDPASPH
jgi:hypothetical protein